MLRQNAKLDKLAEYTSEVLNQIFQFIDFIKTIKQNIDFLHQSDRNIRRNIQNIRRTSAIISSDQKRDEMSVKKYCSSALSGGVSYR